MKAKETNLLTFLQGPKQFLIPIFQRTYSWERSHCEQLWRDIIRVGKDEQAAGHFIGSIVYIERGLYNISAVPQLLVIDGQQRLTTIALLLSALGKSMEARGNGAITERRKLENYYLFNAEENGDLHNKLLLTQSDKDTLIRILTDKELPPDPSPRVVENYRFFTEHLAGAEIDAVYAGVQKLLVVDIALDRNYDNPQLIFESLNSTGLELSQADLIRNYVLMGQEPDIQTRLYEDYWHPMETSFGREYGRYFDSFMRHYLTVKTGSIPKLRDVYTAFKTYVKRSSSPATVEEILVDTYKYSKYYVNMALAREPNAQLRSAFADINTLRVEVAYPLLLELYDDYSSGNQSTDELLVLLRLIESYVFRRAICGIPTNSLNKTFATLMRDVDKEDYVESLQAAFLLMTSYRRFPSDTEFQSEFVVKDVYNFRSRNYLLSKLENHGRKERADVESCTIEHVLPQNPNLSVAWQSELGPDWADVRDKYLHTIGNLTLTGYNPELSDRPFVEKCEMIGGFRDSPLRLNHSLASLDTWNEANIKARAAGLAVQAAAIWSNPQIPEDTLEAFKNKQKADTKQAYTLDQYKYLTGDIQALFHQLRRRILNLDASVTEVYNKFYIAYKTTTNFVDIVPQKSRLRLSLNLAFPEIVDPQNKCKDITHVGRWGNGDVEFGLSTSEELDYSMFLIRQSFEKHIEEDED